MNLATSYQPGKRKTELRVYILTDWENFTRIASEPILVELSELDSSKHRDMQVPPAADKE